MPASAFFACSAIAVGVQVVRRQSVNQTTSTVITRDIAPTVGLASTLCPVLRSRRNTAYNTPYMRPFWLYLTPSTLCMSRQKRIIRRIILRIYASDTGKCCICQPYMLRSKLPYVCRACVHTLARIPDRLVSACFGCREEGSAVRGFVTRAVHHCYHAVVAPAAGCTGLGSELKKMWAS